MLSYGPLFGLCLVAQECDGLAHYASCNLCLCSLQDECAHYFSLRVTTIGSFE